MSGPVSGFSSTVYRVQFSNFLVYVPRIVGWVILIGVLFCHGLQFVDVHAKNFGLIALKVAKWHEKNCIKTNWARESWERMSSCCAGDYSWQALVRQAMPRNILDALAYEWCKSGGVAIVISTGEYAITQEINEYCLYKKNVCFTQLGWQRFLNEVPVAKQLLVTKNQIKNVSVYLISHAAVPSITVKKGVVVTIPVDVRRAGQIVFNDNTIFFINQCSEIHHPKFDALFSKFKSFVRKNDLCDEMFCIDGSSVLALFGLRDVCSDFDFIVHDRRMVEKFNLEKLYPVEVHNKWHKNVDDVIFNPLNHFYMQGLKVASLQFMLDFKKQRNWPKDVKDIMLIQQFLSKSAVII